MRGEPRTEVRPVRSIQRVEASINQRTENDPGTRARLTTMARMIVPTLGLHITPEQRKTFNEVAKLAGERAQKEVETSATQNPINTLDTILVEVAQPFPETSKSRWKLYEASNNLRTTEQTLHNRIEQFQAQAELEGRSADVETAVGRLVDDLNRSDTYSSIYHNTGDNNDPSIEPFLQKVGILPEKATLPMLVDTLQREGKWNAISRGSTDGFSNGIVTNIPGVDLTLIGANIGSDNQSWGVSVAFGREALLNIAKSPPGESFFPRPKPPGRVY